MTGRDVTRRMDAADFAAARVLVGISDRRVEMARRVLVAGEPTQEVASTYGVSRQAVAASVSVLRQACSKWHQARQAAASEGVMLPRGWQCLTLVIPSRLVPTVRRLVATDEAATEPIPSSGKKVGKRRGAIGRRHRAGSGGHVHEEG